MVWKVTVKAINEETDEELNATVLGNPGESASEVLYRAYDTLKKLESGEI